MISLRGIVEKIVQEDLDAQRLLYLYLKKETYPKIEQFMINRGSSIEDVQDWFQEAFIILIMAIQNGKFKHNSFIINGINNQLSAYLMSVVKNIWKKNMRRLARNLPAKKEALEMEIQVDFSAALIQEEYDKLGASCQKLFKLYFVQESSPRVIAKTLNQTTNETKKQIQSCTNKLLKNLSFLLSESHRNTMESLLKAGMNELGERCQKILTSFYYDNKNMSEIAVEMNFANRQVAAEQKNRCMKRINQAIVRVLLRKKEKLS